MNKEVLNQARNLIAGFLKDRRIELGLTQTDLAQRTGLGFRTIQRMENGVYWPGLKQYLIVCEALHLFPAIACFEDSTNFAKMMRETWKQQPKDMSIEDALKLKSERNNRQAQNN